MILQIAFGVALGLILIPVIAVAAGLCVLLLRGVIIAACIWGVFAGSIYLAGNHPFWFFAVLSLMVAAVILDLKRMKA